MANIGESELANMIPEITISAAQDGINYLRESLNVARTVTPNFDAQFASVGDTLKITASGDLSVNDKSANTDVTKQTPSDSAVSLTLDKHKEVSFGIEDAASAQAIEGVMDVYSRQAGERLAEQVEQDIVDAMAAGASNSLAYANFTSGSEWPEMLRRARRILNENRAPMNAAKYAQLDPYAWEDILNTSTIGKVNEFGSNRPVVEGAVDRYAGIDLFESNIVARDTTTSPDTDECPVYTRLSTVVAVRPLPQYGSQFGVSQATVSDPESGLAMRATTSYDANGLNIQMTMDVLYGIVVQRPEQIVLLTHQLANVNA